MPKSKLVDVGVMRTIRHKERERIFKELENWVGNNDWAVKWGPEFWITVDDLLQKIEEMKQ